MFRNFGYLFVVLLLVNYTNAALASATKFDLVCSGTNKSSIARKPSEGTSKDRIRIDLVSKQWCRSTCYYINPIFSVSTDEIVLDESRSSANINSEKVDRRTGIYVRNFISYLAGGITEKVFADCTVAPFSGFPQRKF